MSRHQRPQHPGQPGVPIQPPQYTTSPQGWSAPPQPTPFQAPPNQPQFLAPQPPPRAPWWKNPLILIGLGSAAALVLVIVLIATNTGGGSSSDAHSEASPTVERPSLDVALDTVCKAGSFQNGGKKAFLMNSTSGGHCMSASGGSYISIGTYASSGSYDLKTDVNRGAIGYYAVGELADGQTIVFATTSRSSTTPLEPLTPLGFEIREGGS